MLARHVNDCFQINGKQMTEMVKNDEAVKFKTYTRKIE